MPLGSHIERKRIGLWTPPIYDSYLFASKWHRALSHWYELQLHVIIAFNHFSLVAFGHRTNTDPWQHWKKNVCLKCLSAVVRTCFYLCRLALPLILLNEKFEIKSNKSNFVVWWSVGSIRGTVASSSVDCLLFGSQLSGTRFFHSTNTKSSAVSLRKRKIHDTKFDFCFLSYRCSYAMHSTPTRVNSYRSRCESHCGVFCVCSYVRFLSQILLCFGVPECERNERVMCLCDIMSRNVTSSTFSIAHGVCVCVCVVVAVSWRASAPIQTA